MNEVLETSEWVAGRSVQVGIDEDALRKMSEKMARDDQRVPPWDEGHHFFAGGSRTVWYFLILDSLNFCFWPLRESQGGKLPLDRKRSPDITALRHRRRGPSEKGLFQRCRKP